MLNEVPLEPQVVCLACHSFVCRCNRFRAQRRSVGLHVSVWRSTSSCTEDIPGRPWRARILTPHGTKRIERTRDRRRVDASGASAAVLCT